MKKLLSTIIVALLAITCFVGCMEPTTEDSSSRNQGVSSQSQSSSNSISSSQGVIETNLDYIDVSSSTLTTEQKAEVDKLLYKNTINTTASKGPIAVATADPAVIYCEQDGYYYMYGTYDTPKSGPYHYGIRCFRSKNLTDWENSGFTSSTIGGQEVGFAYKQPYENLLEYSSLSSVMTQAEFDNYTATTWMKYGNQWAPSVMYDVDLGKYLMFSSAQISAKGVTPIKYALFLATSDHPAGPFIPWTGFVKGGTYANGQSFSARQITYADKYIDFTGVTDNYGNYYQDLDAIDAEPFIDPVTGVKYLFFVASRGSSDMPTNNIFGIKMIDWFTPDMSTLTLLAKPNFVKVTDKTKTLSDEGEINEGPCVEYNAENGLYYMTFSVDGFTARTYCVKQAIATSPLGVYEKISAQKGGRVLACEADWIHRAGTGHHTFIRVGNEKFAVYPMHNDKYINKLSTWKARVIGCDRVEWVRNDDGLLVMATDGPSYDYRLRPDLHTGYTNVASRATVSCNQKQSDAKIEYLTDREINMLINEGKYDFNANKAPLEITLDFDNPISLKGVMVTNSRNLERAFEKISKIEIEYTKNGQKYKSTIGQVNFDWESFYNQNMLTDGYPMLIAGCNSTAIFEEIQNVSKVKIYLENQIWDSVEGLSLAEITVIGK